jgi:Zn-dependent peptidase ImmA (M78 family)
MSAATDEPYNPYAVLRANPEWTVEWSCDLLPPGTRARWYEGLKTLITASGLTRVERRCVVAHEVEHALAGHRGDVPERVHLRQEQYADQEAAYKLIPIRLLAEALEWSNDWFEVADYCDVTERLLRVRIDHLHPSEEALLRRVQEERHQA